MNYAITTSTFETVSRSPRQHHGRRSSQHHKRASSRCFKWTFGGDVTLQPDNINLSSNMCTIHSSRVGDQIWRRRHQQELMSLQRPSRLCRAGISLRLSMFPLERMALLLVRRQYRAHVQINPPVCDGMGLHCNLLPALLCILFPTLIRLQIFSPNHLLHLDFFYLA